MPWEIKNRQCTRSDGRRGNYVVVKTPTGEAVGCHTSRSSAASQIRALNAAENARKVDQTIRDFKKHCSDRLESL